MPRKKKGPKPHKQPKAKIAVISLDHGPIPMIDIGANLIDGMFQGNYRGSHKHAPDVDVVIQRGQAVGVEKIIVTAGSLEESREAFQYACNATGLFSTVGVHPTRCDLFDQCEGGPDDYTEQLLKVAQDGVKSGTVVAIGECGLDYARTEFCAKETQLEHFARHFILTEQTGLPMFLHCRDAAHDLIPLLTANRHRFNHAVVHSFDGSTEEMKAFTDIGLHIGINGCSLRAEANLATAAAIPEALLMIETDAPWCEIRPSHAGYAHVQSKWPTVKNSKYTPPLTIAEEKEGSETQETKIEREGNEIKEEKDKFESNEQKNGGAGLIGGVRVKSRQEPCHLLQVLEVVSAIRSRDKYDLASVIYANTMAVFFPPR